MKKGQIILLIIVLVVLVIITVVLYRLGQNTAALFLTFADVVVGIISLLKIKKSGNISVIAGKNIDNLKVHGKGDISVNAGENITKTQINKKDK